MGRTLVAVRCRPFNKREIEMGARCVLEMTGNQTAIIDPKKHDRKTFNFDYSYWSFDPSDPNFAPQEQVFVDLGTVILNNAFEGYNGCLFAYGQTGSGKSYSMMGYGAETGIIPRLCDALIKRAEDMKATQADWSYKLEVSFLEIYNEKVRCLLNPAKDSSKELKVREHPSTGPYVEGLAQVLVASFKEIEDLMEKGNMARTVAATAMNASSSRSHSIFTLMLTMIRKDLGSIVSKINLVDLAGSERADKTGATGATLQEGSNINKSLTTLGLVISSLSKGGGDKKGDFIPYRDSTLTWLLRENLGGNSKTIMIATLSPHADNFEESLSTLRYAERAKKIESKAVVNEDPKARQIRELKEEIERLRSQMTAASPRGETVERLAEAETLFKDLNMSWEDKARVAAVLQAERTKNLERLGIIGTVDKTLPRFINLNEDPLMDAALVYYFKKGDTTIGSEATDGDGFVDFILPGESVASRHCIVHHPEGDDPVLTLEPLPGALVRVNGKLLEEITPLREGDRIVIGEHHLFRFSDPLAAKRRRERGEVDPVAPAVGEEKKDWKFAIEELAAAKAENMAAEIAKAHVEEIGNKLAETQVKMEEQEKTLQETQVRARQNSLRRRKAEDRIAELERHLQMVAATAEAAPPSPVLAPTASPTARAAAQVTDGSSPPRHLQLVGPRETMLKRQVEESTDFGTSVSQRQSTWKSNISKYIEGIPTKVKTTLVYKWKVTFIGHEEVGKTSLLRCLLSEPKLWFNKKLPDVQSTTGIDISEHKLTVETEFGEEVVQLQLLDLAGQQVYHSHGLFLTDRSLYIFVWKMSSLEQIRESGMSEWEEERLMQWVEEVQSRSAGCSLILVGTHKDAIPKLTTQECTDILARVRKRVEDYIDSVAIDAEHKVRVLGSFAVSCKDRSVVGVEARKAKDPKMSDLLSFIGKMCLESCKAQEQYSQGAVPGRHLQLLQTVQNMKKEELFCDMGVYLQMVQHWGIQQDEELVDVTNLLHSWNALYVFTRATTVQQLKAQAYMFLNVTWLWDVVSAIFAYAHWCQTEPAKRAKIGGMPFSPEAAQRADRLDLFTKAGILTIPLAQVMYGELLKRVNRSATATHDVQLILDVLIMLDSICSNPHDKDAKGGFTYYVPSLFPTRVTEECGLRNHLPALFQRGCSRLYLMNIFPKEFFGRLQCRLMNNVVRLSVDDDFTLEDVRAEIGATSSQCQRNNWSNAMWLGERDHVRALVFLGEACLYVWYCPDQPLPTELQSDFTVADGPAFRGYVESEIRSIADEYTGVQLTPCVPCHGVVDGQSCENWFSQPMVLREYHLGRRLQCSQCGGDFEAQALLEPLKGTVPLPQETGEILIQVLGGSAARSLCKSLDVRLALTDAGLENSSEAEPHPSPGQALDKLVRALMVLDRPHFTRAW